MSEICFPQVAGNSFYYQPEFLVLDSRPNNLQLYLFLHEAENERHQQ